MQPHRRRLEAHRGVDRRRRAARVLRRQALLPLWLLDRWPCRGRPAPAESGLAGRVECVAERVVQRAQTDLVAGGDLLAGAHESCPRPPLLGHDDRPDDPLQRRVKALHERVRVVEAAAVDAHDDLRSPRLQRLSLEPLDRLAANLAVQVPGAGTGLETGERRLVRGPPGQDDQAAAAGGTGGAERDRLRGPTNDDPHRHAALKLELVVEQQRPLRIRLGRRVADELERLTGKLEQQLAAVVLEDRSQLDEVGHEPAQAGVRRQSPVCERGRHPRPVARNSELAANRRRGRCVEHMRVDVGLVASSGEEPRFDRSPAPHALDSTATLREPDIA